MCAALGVQLGQQQQTVSQRRHGCFPYPTAHISPGAHSRLRYIMPGFQSQPCKKSDMCTALGVHPGQKQEIFSQRGHGCFPHPAAHISPGAQPADWERCVLAATVRRQSVRGRQTRRGEREEADFFSSSSPLSSPFSSLPLPPPGLL